MMATTRREFLQAGMVAGLAAAATLPALKALAQTTPVVPTYQHAADPAHLTALETKHWPKLAIKGKLTTGQPYQLMIQIGQQIHPMTTAHHIEWVEVWSGDTKVARVDFAEPTLAQPVLTVNLVRNAPSELKVRMSCNLHGLWENTIVA
jgi:superoxide reductase